MTNTFCASNGRLKVPLSRTELLKTHTQRMSKDLGQDGTEVAFLRPKASLHLYVIYKVSYWLSLVTDAVLETKSVIWE